MVLVNFTNQNIAHKRGRKVTNKKIKILTLSDHPFLPSGVGTQTKYILETLLDTGRYQVVSLGGAITHPNYNPVKTEKYGEDWIVYPVDGYGNPDMLRQMIHHHKPDILYFMTDPRFYEWLWNMEDEIRPLVPMVYYHVWDNTPYPAFNKKWYDSTDVIATISKVTSDIVQTVAPEAEEYYIPHAVNTDIFKPPSTESERALVKNVRESNMGVTDKVIFFWNNRNARRKQSGTLIFWFKEFLDKVGKDKACLLMHTDVRDPHGQPLDYIIEELGLNNGEVLFSTEKLQQDQLSILYKMADCTVNISDAEGFGLATLESLSCGTPIIVSMTGGLQEQVTDGEDFFGVGIEPSSKAIIGSQQVPFIFEDRINKDDFIAALEKIYNMTMEDRTALGLRGREHIMKNYNFSDFKNNWITLMDKIHDEHGSWENRKKYNSWECITV